MGKGMSRRKPLSGEKRYSMRAHITRKMFYTAVLGFLGVFFLAEHQAAAQGNAEAGARLYKEVENCKECHGDGGKGDGFILPLFFFFSSRRRHTRLTCDWSSDVCSSD